LMQFIPACTISDCADVLVSVMPPLGTQRTPSDICCVIDVSDSMGDDVIVQDSLRSVTSHGLRRVDIVKHAVRTIVHILGTGDRLALVTYADRANQLLDLTPMTPVGRTLAERRLDLLQLDGMTNIWAGLEMGIGVLSDATRRGRLQHLLLLTDGMPTINPPRGIRPMLERLKKNSGGNLPCSISTFGFGCDVDSELLQDIAAAGSGSYAFIPDADFVGTMFVNAMANLLATMACDVVLELEPLAGAAILHVHVPEVCAHKQPVLRRSMTASSQKDRQCLQLRPLQFGQSRDVLVHMSGLQDTGATALLQATLHYRTRAGKPPEQIVVMGCRPARPTPDGLAKLERERCRIAFVEGLASAMSLMRLTRMDKMQGRQLPLIDAQHKLQELDAQITASPGAETPEVESILEDLRGQVAEAFSREDWFTKWGLHFLPSLLCAHAAQQCNNFKDPGVQHYGGELFHNLRDEAEDIFLGLPAPQPTLRRAATAPTQPTQAPTAAAGSAMIAVAAAPVRFAVANTAPTSMAAYYDCRAG